MMCAISRTVAWTFIVQHCTQDLHTITVKRYGPRKRKRRRMRQCECCDGHSKWWTLIFFLMMRTMMLCIMEISLDKPHVPCVVLEHNTPKIKEAKSEIRVHGEFMCSSMGPNKWHQLFSCKSTPVIFFFLCVYFQKKSFQCFSLWGCWLIISIWQEQRQVWRFRDGLRKTFLSFTLVSTSYLFFLSFSVCCCCCCCF